MDILNNQKFIPFNRIKFLDSPGEFFSAIICFLKESRVALIACLYMGTGKSSCEILDEIKKRKSRGQSTKVLLDKNRMKRTPEFIELLKKKEIENIFIFYDHSPKIPVFSALKELFSVIHSKIFIFDDDVIITGANLDDSYMKDKLDRYLVVSDSNLSTELRDFYHKIYQKSFVSSDYSYDHIKSNSRICIYNQKSEYDILKNILERFSFENLTISTAYPNFPQKYINLFKKTQMNIIVPSLKTSTYNTDQVFKSQIKEMYNLFTSNISNSLKNARIYEFSGQEIYFHCKGLWGFSDKLSCFILGSSNFNVRSLERDIETNFLIITEDLAMKNVFMSEHDSIISRCKIYSPVDSNSLIRSCITKFYAFALKRFM